MQTRSRKRPKIKKITVLAAFALWPDRRSVKLVDLLSGYADADWGNSSARRSTSGMIMLYNKSPIMWKSKMEKTTALSTAEAEYYSASAAGCEVLYLRDLLRRIRLCCMTCFVGSGTLRRQ